MTSTFTCEGIITFLILQFVIIAGDSKFPGVLPACPQPRVVVYDNKSTPMFPSPGNIYGHNWRVSVLRGLFLDGEQSWNFAASGRST